MSSVMKYKGYIGSVEFSEEDQIFYGKVLGIHALISYEGESAKELIQDFHDPVDDYLELCVEKRIEPEKAYKGSFNVRISPDFHRSIAYPCHSRWNDSKQICGRGTAECNLCNIIL